MPTVVWASYEDPTKPDIIHNQIIRSDEYLEANRPGGQNEQRHSRSILIFLFTYWEDEMRPRLAQANGVDPNEIQSDIMGDLRVLRNVILHAKSIIRPDKHASLRLLGDMFEVDKELVFSYEGMHKIFVLINQDCARLLFGWLGVEDGPVKPEQLKDVAPFSSGHSALKRQSQMRPNKALNLASNSAAQMTALPFWHQPLEVRPNLAALFHAGYRRSVEPANVYGKTGTRQRMGSSKEKNSRTVDCSEHWHVVARPYRKNGDPPRRGWRT